jgi:hypothetical protein
VLPLTITAIFAALELLSFVHIAVSAAIAIDKLNLLVIALLPVAYICGAGISVVDLIRARKKATASVGLILNVALLIALVYFGKSFLKEFNFIG